MTFVGKILVIIILVFSLFFLALSAVVSSTAENWDAKVKTAQKSISDLNNKLSEKTAAAEAAAKNMKDATDDLDTAKKNYEAQINARQRDLDSVRKEITENRTLLETAQNNAQEALNVAKARTEESDQLKAVVTSTQTQANQFKEQQRDLNDRIRILQREVEVAKENNKTLRNRVEKLNSVLYLKNINPDTVTSGTAPPPSVEAKITRVDSQNRHVEISAGSDDGLKPGHVLSVFSLNPVAYKGRIVIESADGDQAVGRVQGTTINGQRILEGDNVSSKIR